MDYYYLIAPLSTSSRHSDTFTYSSASKLNIGQVVKIPLRTDKVQGVVVEPTSRPDFKTKAIIEQLDLPPLPAHLLELAKWLSAYYTAPLGSVLGMILPARLNVKKAASLAKPTTTRSAINELHDQQKQVLKRINQSRCRQFLLHGATGSGKTQIYIELARLALKQGRSSLILVPEIALTSQTVDQFALVFKNKVIVTHSGLSSAKRRDTWQTILTNPEPLIVIGPRSALFMPFNNLGLIVIDEAHEPSYKQEQSPRYHALPTAAYLAKLTGARLVLGSATPGINELYLAQIGRLELLQMPDRVGTAKPPKISVVDMRDATQRSTTPYISQLLIDSLRQTLSQEQQSLIFINRRGSATQVLCQDCGYVFECPNCQIPLTFHGDEGILRCHWCGLTQKPPANCPSCGSLNILYLGIGTKRIESDLKQLLPNARIARLDRDSFKPQNLNDLMGRLHQGEIDILIGTQMIAKGLDIPSVALVGVIMADLSLYIPDFNATERTYQLLHQVNGRAGRRANIDGQTIIQTYNPDHPSITAVANHDFNRLVNSELAERKLLRYPPYSYLLKLSIRRSSRASAQQAAKELAAKLIGSHRNISVMGPAPAFRETLNGKFTWQLIIKSPKRGTLVEICRNLPSGWAFDIDPVDLL